MSAFGSRNLSKDFSNTVRWSFFGHFSKIWVTYLFIYLFAQAHTLCTIRQGLEQDSKAQTCTDL